MRDGHRNGFYFILIKGQGFKNSVRICLQDKAVTKLRLEFLELTHFKN